MTRINVEFGAYALSADLKNGEWKVGPRGGKPMLASRGPLMLSPEIKGCAVGAGVIEDCGVQPDRARLLRITGLLSGITDGKVINKIWLLEDRIVCESSYTCDSSHALEHWIISSEGGCLHADKLHAFVGVHGGRDDNGTVLDANDTIDLSTATHNWMYANAAPRLLISRGGLNAVIGGTKVANDFGLELKSSGGLIHNLRFNYGGTEFPWKIDGASTNMGPRLQIQFSRTSHQEDAHALFTQAMIDDGIVDCRRHAPEESAWRKPWYCTWGDQTAISAAGLRQEQAGQSKYSDIKAVLTHDFVLNAAKFIREKGLNIGTIIIDDGWQDKRGDWNLDTVKFPDMRGLVDKLHYMDFKVAIWLAPFLTEPGAEILKRPGFTSGPVSKHKQTVVDYGNPEVREWICSKFDLWFSSAAGCWDIDGLKLDFLLEKIYPDTGCSDPEWRGEERMFFKLFRMFDRQIRRHKPIPGLLHAPYNAHWMECCASLYGEERFDSDVDYLEARPRLIEAVAPGAWISPHFNYNVEVVPEFLRKVETIGGIAQIGKLLCREMTPARIKELREILAGWNCKDVRK